MNDTKPYTLRFYIRGIHSQAEIRDMVLKIVRPHQGNSRLGALVKDIVAVPSEPTPDELKAHFMKYAEKERSMILMEGFAEATCYDDYLAAYWEWRDPEDVQEAFEVASDLMILAEGALTGGK